MDKERITNYNCPVDAAMDILGGNYKAFIIYKLINKTLRYNEIQKLIPKATPRMLSKQLRELEQDNIISRKIYPVVPPKTEYSLTEWGKTLIPVVIALADWGKLLYHQAGVDLPC